MNPFSFRLERLLKYRSHLEKMAQRNLFRANNEVMVGQKAIEKLVESRMEIARKCSEERFRGMNVPQYQIYRSFLKKLDDDLVRAHMNLREAEEKVKAKKEALKKETIKKKTLEALKDYQLKTYMTRLEREEQKIMDELAIIRTGGRA